MIHYDFSCNALNDMCFHVTVLKTCGHELQQFSRYNENLVSGKTTTGFQRGETIKTTSTEHFSPQLPQSPQYVIRLSPVIVSFPALKIKKDVSFYPPLIKQLPMNSWTWRIIP